MTCLVACDLQHSFICNLVLAVIETPSILLKRQIYANLKLTNQYDNETMISSYHHIWLQYCTLRTIQPIYFHIHLDLGPSQGSVLVMSLLPFWNVPSLCRQSFRPQRSSRHLRLFLVSEPWLRKKLHVWWVWWKVILCSPYSSPRGRDRQTLESRVHTVHKGWDNSYYLWHHATLCRGREAEVVRRREGKQWNCVHLKPGQVG